MNLHQWGAVTLFHGLPSDRVRAIAQGDGAMWFGTDAGLARYDGRRTQTIAAEGLAARRVLALVFNEEGALWIGTDDGAFVRAPSGEFQTLAETKGKTITAISTPAPGRAMLATTDGLIFDCQKQEDETIAVEKSGDRLTLTERVAPLERLTPAKRAAPAAAAAPATTPGSFTRQPLELTSLAQSGNTIYVGTRGRGLLGVEGGAARELSSKARALQVGSITQSQDGEIFFGAQTPAGDGGVFKLEESGGRTPDALRAVKINKGATGAVTALRFGAGGDLFVGTETQGVYRYRNGQRLEHFTFEGTAGGLRSNRIYAVFVDREGVAWFGTDRGVCRYDPQGLSIETVSTDAESNFVRALYRTRKGRLLCGTNRGLYIYDETSETWRGVEGLANKMVYAINEDARGLLLIGSASGLYVGLPIEAQRESKSLQLTPADKTDAESREGRDEATSEQASEPVSTGSVRAIAVLRGATYIATYGRGVERMDEGQRRALIWPVEATDARGREVVSLYADEARGRLWIGTANRGVFYFDGQHVASEPALAKLGGSTVWSVSSAGADAAEQTGGEPGAGDGKPGNASNAGGEGGEWLWLATGQGLYAYQAGRSLVTVVPNADVRSVVAVEAAQANQPDASNALRDAGQQSSQTPSRQAWCATAGGGVLKVSLDEQFGAITSRLDAEQGLPTQSAFAVLPLKNAGAAGRETLLVGTTRGLVRYAPGSVVPTFAPTRITTSRPRQIEELREGLRLEYPQNSLVLDVAATGSRTFPEQFQYAFLLYDQTGRIIKRKLSHDSQFQIVNLRAGRYRLVARAYTIDLVSSQPLAFEFEVARAPFPWTTTALSVLLALALVALLWGYIQHKKIMLTGVELMNANRQLAAARLQLANEAESERRRIARDLHDQTLADLRRLILLADEMQEDGVSVSGIAVGRLSKVDPVVLRAEIESISHEIRRICEDLSPSVLENVGFVAALEWALTERVAHLPSDGKFTYEFICDDEIEQRLRLSPGVQMQIYRIVQEAVSNICRHASATHVRLAVEASEENNLVLTLEDDGRGLPPENRKAKLGRGLTNIRARASLIEAEVEWRRREEGGTVFVLQKASERARATE